VTTSGDGEFIIHTPAEKDLIPIVLHHYPICVSYALFGEGKIPVADPTALEERVSDASLVLAINAYKELCCMHLTGFSLTSPRLILQCSEIAANRAKRVVEFIKSTLEEDEKERADESTPRKGLISKLSSSVNTNFRDVQPVESLSSSHQGDEQMQEDSAEEEVVCGPANLIDSKTVASKKWSEENESESSSDESESDQEMKPKAVKPDKRKKKQQNSDDDSEEEETIVL
jgi:3' exoribonuclease family, domain 2